MISQGLRTWFVIHFVLDVLFAVPLIFAPIAFLSFFGWTTIDPLATRLVGAALMGIGVESYLGRNAGLEAYKGMLNLKIIWSATATFGLLVTMLVNQEPWAGWLLVALFGSFCALWSYYRIRLERELD
jgi:hypothetical protein